MASVAEAVAAYDAWCEARGGAEDDREEEAVDRLRNALDTALDDAERSSSPRDALLDTARALLDGDPRTEGFGCVESRGDGTPRELFTRRTRRALEAVGDHAVAGLVRVADLAGSPDAEAVACAALRAFARAAESPRDAFVAVLERLHVRAEQLRRDRNGGARGWRLAAECLRAMAALLARVAERRDPALHALDAEPLVARVEAIAEAAATATTERGGLLDDARDVDDVDDVVVVVDRASWGSPAEALEAARAYRASVLRLFAGDVSCRPTEKDDARRTTRDARIVRQCLAWLARDPSPETLRLAAAATRARGAGDVETLWSFATARHRRRDESAHAEDDDDDEEEDDDLDADASSEEEASFLAGAVVLAAAWLVAAEARSPFPEPFPEDSFFRARPGRVAALAAAAFAAADGSADDARGALNASAVHFSALAFRRCGEGGAAKDKSASRARRDGDGDEKKTAPFARALVFLETRVASAPSPAFTELARLAHARLLTAVDDDTRFDLIAARIGDENRDVRGSNPAPPAMRALYLSRLRRETHRATTETEAPKASEPGGSTRRSPFTSPRVVELVVRACVSAIRSLEAAGEASRETETGAANEKGREDAGDGVDDTPPTDEDADALVAGLNFFRLVLGRALAGHLRADGAEVGDVAGVRSRRALIEARVAAPATAWARATLARLDEALEGAASVEGKRTFLGETDDAFASRAWRARMGAEHVLEAARFVSELCDASRRDGADVASTE